MLIIDNEKFELGEDSLRFLDEDRTFNFEYKTLEGNIRNFHDVYIEQVYLTKDNNVVIYINDHHLYKSLRIDRIVSPKVSYQE